MGSSPAHQDRAHDHWLHFALLVGVVSTFEVGRMLVDNDPFALSLVLHTVYQWIPALSGIAVSIAVPDQRLTRRTIPLGLLASALMIGLDLWSSTLQPGLRESAGLFPDASLGPMAELSEAAAVSWVKVGVDWISGDLGVLNPIVGNYDLSHPRLRAAEALTEGGLILLVFATLGFVIAATSWIRVHVIFRRPESRRTSQIVIAWLTAPLLTDLTRSLAADQRYETLFNDGALWRAIVPSVVFLILGLMAWWYTARYREPDPS